jgi:hypothetical protein
MRQEDILQMAWNSLFIMLFISSIITLASGGGSFLHRSNGQTAYDNINNWISIKSASATVSGILDNAINSSENPLAFDIVLSIINVGLYLLKIFSFLILTLVTFFTLGFWLSSSGAPGAITGLLVMSWQFWTLYYIAKFVFWNRVPGGGR